MNMTARFDERDNVFSRRDLAEGTPESVEYYSRHPELLERDRYFKSLGGFGQGIHPADFDMFDASSWFMTRIGSPDAVDGTPVGKTIKLTPERFTEKIKSYAQVLGADLVGISELNPAYVYSHRGRRNVPQETCGEPINLNHRFAISLGFHEDLDLIRTGPYPSEMVETGRVYMQSAVVSVVLAQYIRMLGYPARAHHFRNYQVLPVPIAVDGGLGELGRCGFLVTSEFGNCLRLSTVTTDLPLVRDEPVDLGMQDFCSMCRLCAEACPSGAITTGDKTDVRGVRKWQIDDVKCIAYWNRVGTDCGMCIGSCPWSLPDRWWHRISVKFAARSHLARVALLWLYPLLFGKYRPKQMPGWMERRTVNNNPGE